MPRVRCSGRGKRLTGSSKRKHAARHCQRRIFSYVHPVMKAPRSLTDEGMELLARRFAVLGDPMRLKLLHALFEGEKSVNELVALSGTTQPNVSRHLQKLTHTGTISRRKQGTQVYYAIADQTLFKLCELVCNSLEKQLAAQVGSFRRTG